MPIRFRCAYCNQLMGIARRKAGTVVQCPRCAGQVIVPDPPSKESKKDKSKAKNAGEIFERSDLDNLLQQEPAVHHPNPPSMASGNGEPFGPPLPGVSVQQGILLTPLWLTILAVSIVLLMGLSFFFGLLLGRQF